MGAAPNAARCSGADLSCAGKDSGDVLSVGKSGGGGGDEPVFAGALRHRLALRAGAASAALARLREDEGALRDAQHLAGVDAALSPGARLHRLWRLFATRPTRFDARVLRVAADCLDLPPDIDCDALIAAAHETMGETPLAAATRVSAETLRVLNDASPIDVEIFALWLADLVLAQQLRWDAPLPLLATMIAHPSVRNASSGGASNSAADVSSGAGNIRAALGRRPRLGDADWSLSVMRAYARAAQETYALAGELSRRAETLLRAAPKLRAKKATRVVDLLLADDCVSASRAAKTAGLSDRAARRLFDRLSELGAVRELTGRANFRLYGL
ncbi:DUF1403 family protein [Methylocystis sp. FS]|uniref:DUF1403 family protein n=1 Tax=Methylocystis silviterrae TaxID=2743612 RepID=UPI001583478E|nr:DUF1403 family protein [Methylocystis silviterrae]NUJ79345.1 DUF1403 family protein [Methylocystis silviterrae]